MMQSTNFRKAVFSAIAFLFIASSSFAETIQMHISGMNTTAINTGALTYFPWDSSGGASTTEANRQIVAPTAGTIIYMKAYLTAAPQNGAGSQTVTVAMRVAGSTTGTSCVITEDETSCESNTSSTYSAGNLLAIIETPANTPAASNLMVVYWTVDNTNNKTFYSSQPQTNFSNSVTNYAAFSPGSGPVTDENLAQIPIPFAFTATALYCQTLFGTPGAGNSYAMTVYHNGSGVGKLTCTISDAATTCNDTTNTFSGSAGDTLSFEVIPASLPTARPVTCGIALTNTVGGFALIGGKNSSFADATSTFYHPLVGPFSESATENQRQQTSTQMQLLAVYVATHADPDNGANTQSYTVSLMDDTSATNCSCAVSDGLVACNDTCTDDVLTTSLMDWRSVPANTPTVTGLWVSAWAFINPRTFFMVN